MRQLAHPPRTPLPSSLASAAVPSNAPAPSRPRAFPNWLTLLTVVTCLYRLLKRRQVVGSYQAEPGNWAGRQDIQHGHC